MFPAAKHNYFELIIVTLTFSVVTMLTVVLATSFGISFLPMQKMEKYNHALAGVTIFLCGLGMLFLGL